MATHTKRSLALGALLLFLIGGTALAAPVKWSLQNANFVDGGMASGWFIYDATSNAVGPYLIDVSGGDTATFPAFTYEAGVAPNTAAYAFSSPMYVVFDTNIPSPDPDYPEAFRELRVQVATWMTDTGGEIPMSSGEECYNCSPFRSFARGGSIVGQPVPEPTLLALLGVGLGVVGRAVRRRRT